MPRKSLDLFGPQFPICGMGQGWEGGSSTDFLARSTRAAMNVMNERDLGVDCCCRSVAKWCLTLHDPMHCSMPGFSVLHNVPEFDQAHVLESVMPSNHLILCHPLLLLPRSFPASGSFPMTQFFASGGQNIGVSISTSVLPMNIQDLSPLGRTGWISLQSKGLSRVFSNFSKSISSL